MSFTADSSRPSSEINVTPLIDVLLVLLVIFMVIVPVTPRGLESSVPPDRAAAPAPPPVQVRVSVGDAIVPVRYSIGTQQVAYAEVQPRLRALLAVRQDRTLLVAADRDLSFQRVAEVVAEGRQAGASAVVLHGLQP